MDAYSEVRRVDFSRYQAMGLHPRWFHETVIAIEIKVHSYFWSVHFLLEGQMLHETFLDGSPRQNSGLE